MTRSAPRRATAPSPTRRTRLPFAKGDQERWQESLWESFDGARRECLLAAARTGGTYELAIARILDAIWEDHRRGERAVVDDLSERARERLDPADVEFSKQVRASRASKVLDELEADLSFRAYAEGSEDALGTMHLPLRLVAQASPLLPSHLRDVGPEVEVAIIADLRGEDAQSGALRRIRNRLQEAGGRAPASARGDLARAVLEVERRRIVNLVDRKGLSNERGRARAVVGAVLRGWGMPGDAVEDLFRFDTKRPSADRVRAARPRPTRPLILVSSDSVSPRLCGAWASWKATVPLLEKEIEQRVLVVLEAIVNAGDDEGRTWLERTGTSTLEALRQRTASPFLRAPTDKASAMHHELTEVVADEYGKLLEYLGTRDAMRQQRGARSASVSAKLVTLVERFFPWHVGGLSQCSMGLVERGMKKDMAKLGHVERDDVSRDQLAGRATGLADARAERFVRVALRRGGMSASAAHELFPRRK